MGSRNESITHEERAEAAMRRVLSTLGEPAVLEPPPDLVTRTARRLPTLAPNRAEQRVTRRGWLVGLAASIGAVVLVFALVNILQSFGILSPSFLAVGDGQGGLSRVLLALHLLVKPLLHTLGTLNTWLLAAGVLFAAGTAWLWWHVFQRTPAIVVAEAVQ